MPWSETSACVVVLLEFPMAVQLKLVLHELEGARLILM